MKKAIWFCLLPGLAQAVSPLGNVGTARVDAGALSAEQRFGYTDDARFQMRQHVDVGVSDWYALRVVAAQDKRPHDHLEWGSVTLENRFQLVEQRDAGWDGGIRLVYTQRDGDKTPHQLDIRWLAMGAFGAKERWHWRHNSLLMHDVGQGRRAGLKLELRHQLTYQFALPASGLRAWQVGAEMFNDFGRLRDLSGYAHQDHQFGPVARLSFDNGLYLQAGYRAGLSADAPDHLFKFFIGKAF